jgi:hypothetical protein|tara:strand:- start:766 stop:1041 length:276 start_codon:yes stop_codon:yes gene_type:complete
MKKGKGFGDDFIKNLLLTLEETNFDEFMNLSYAVMMQSPSNVLKRKDSIETKVDAINNMIEYFEESEAYEKCTNLQKLKHLLFLEADEGDI